MILNGLKIRNNLSILKSIETNISTIAVITIKKSNLDHESFK